MYSQEAPMFVRFTNDGEWLCCGTDNGFRVYSWSAVVATDGEDMPEARWRHDMEGLVDRFPTGYVFAIVPETSGSGVLFGGLIGQLFRMDLESGDVRCLLTLPEQASINQLVMSRDGEALGIVSCRHSLDPDHRYCDRGTWWSIWSYPKLLEQRV
jgi:hypothetical protein